MLHSVPSQGYFQHRRRLAELEAMLSSEAGRRYQAEQYVGLDLPKFEI